MTNGADLGAAWSGSAGRRRHGRWQAALTVAAVIALASGCGGDDSDGGSAPVGEAVLSQLDAPGDAWQREPAADVLGVESAGTGVSYVVSIDGDVEGEIDVESACREAAAWMAEAAEVLPTDGEAQDRVAVDDCRAGVAQVARGAAQIILASTGADDDGVHYLAFLTAEQPRALRVTVTAESLQP